ncbi:YheC/YheD family protein [Bacillus sp. JJ1503]|uniref:YheC/YheD family endospore coat-associated protein n=1 Tax=unclassified Bacillus (in: firmicutes) TaxID=185979 RepID=UPI0030001084
MSIFYDLELKNWFTLNKQSKTLGFNKHPVQMVSSAPAWSLSFHISPQKEVPLIGILTGRKKDNKVTGNGRLFKELQKEIIKNGGISIVFTPQNINDHSIKGYMYHPTKDKWYAVQCPIPHVIYNRVPFRRIEKSDSFYEAYQFFKSKNIPFFNTCFLDKHELYQVLSKDSYFQKLMPETIKICEKPSLMNFFEMHRQLYLKPSLGSKGKGIYLASLNKDSTIKLQGHEELHLYEDFHTFWMKWNSVFLKKSYIAQNAIDPLLYNGKRFDFRILVHYVNNQFNVTGIGIRQSKEQNITTHVPNGGIILPYKQLQSKEHDQFIVEVADRAGKLLSKEIGFFGEFSIDAGISADGQYVIYEINSKPMRFDEQEIERKRFQTLACLFLELAGF